MRIRFASLLCAPVAAALAVGLAGPAPQATAAPPPAPAGSQAAERLARSPELSETRRLADRRALVVGSRFYAIGTADGLYPAMGFHTRGEMGGFWTPPLKLLDGLWFGVDGRWLQRARRFTSGWGYTRIAYGRIGGSGVRVTRTDVVPDGLRAGLVGLTLRSTGGPQRVRLAMEAHSELMSAYPWGETTPSQLDYNLPDRGRRAGRALLFRETGRPPVRNAPRHDFAAVVGSRLRPVASRLGPDFRGPQDPAVICPPSGEGQPEAPERCDDTAYGDGTGGRLGYRVRVPAGRPVTVWFAVAGSDHGVVAARAQHRRALRDPAGALARKVAERKAWNRNTVVDLPGDRLLQRSVRWSKQNLLDSVQESRGLRLRVVSAGERFPAAEGRLARARWLGAGWPDYPWLFGTDGEYTAFASVAMGQFADIADHLRALRDVSDIVNERSGKVVHEVTPDGAVYFGANEDEGNTDETSKFPSAVALIWRWTGDDAFLDEMYGFTRRNMRYVVRQLDADGDGWPEGLGNVEREGMGVEKLDNTVYTIRGLRDLADLARARGDTATRRWAARHARALERRFEQTWWYGEGTRQYADSIDDPTNSVNDHTRIFQRHWIGLTPTDAVLVRPGRLPRPLASDRHGNLALQQRQRRCYTGEFGLFHTGTGPTSAEGGNPGPSCDRVVSTVPSERSVFSLNTAIAAVSQGNYGRLGVGQQQRYTTANARIQLDRRVWEQPGSMPEIAPSPDFGANIDRPLNERSMVLQAWGAYGVLWPIVHQQLGISPDLGRGRLDVIPQVPAGQHRVAGRNVRLGAGAVDVVATRGGGVRRTTVTRHLAVRLRVGHVLPAGARVQAVRLDGRPVRYRVERTARGRVVLVDAGGGAGRTQLAVRLG